MPHRDQEVIEAVLKKVTGKIRTVISALAPAMVSTIQAIFPESTHILDWFHLLQFFTSAQQRRRRFLGEAKKNHKARFIERCLARKSEELTLEERGFVQQWLLKDFHTEHIYEALNNMRYVLKAKMWTQAKRS